MLDKQKAGSALLCLFLSASQQQKVVVYKESIVGSPSPVTFLMTALSGERRGKLSSVFAYQEQTVQDQGACSGRRSAPQLDSCVLPCLTRLCCFIVLQHRCHGALSPPWAVWLPGCMCQQPAISPSCCWVSFIAKFLFLLPLLLKSSTGFSCHTQCSCKCLPLV